VQYYRIKNWQKYQYGSGEPRYEKLPWIKLHRDLINSRMWIKANPTQRSLAIVLLVSCDSCGQFASDLRHISALFGSNSRSIRVQFALNFLLEMGFIELIDESERQLSSPRRSDKIREDQSEKSLVKQVRELREKNGLAIDERTKQLTES